MLWVLFSAIAILIGIALFSKVQTELPDEIAFLKSKPPASQVLDTTAEAGGNMSAIAMDGPATGWTLQADGQMSEAFKDFEQAITGPNGQVYDHPSFAITCYQGSLYARVNSRIRASGDAPIAFELQGMPAWAAAANQNWYSADAKRALSLLKAQGKVTVRIAFDEAGTQKFAFNTNGLSSTLAKMTGCAL